MTLKEIIVAYRTEHHLSQRQFALRCGLSNGYISMIEREENPKTGQPITPTLQKLKQLADGMGMTLSELFKTADDMPVALMAESEPEPAPAPETHASNLLPFPEMPLVPIIGRVACGQPITAEENVEGYTGLPADWHADFILICQGSSMEPKIMDGDAVAIRKVEEVHNGQIAAVRIGDEATLKKVYRYSDRLELRPINTDFEPIILWREDMNSAAIEGRAVGLCRGI